jgi:PKD domain
MACLALLAGMSAPALAAPPSVSVSFTWSPHDPVVGQAITFVSTSTVGGNNTIQAELWDLDGDGQFGDQSGGTATTSFSTPGSHLVGLRVIDKHGAHNHIRTATVTVQPFADQPPAASFAFYPGSPLAGQGVSFYSTATDPDSAIAAQRWDLDGNGSYGDALGPTAARSFAVPGSYTVGLQVEDTAGAVSIAHRTLVVLESSTPVSVAGGLRPLFPFPVVRFSGTIESTGIRVRRLTVNAPAGARTAVRCRGRPCPFRWRHYVHGSAVATQVVGVRRLSRRFLRAGTVLQVFVTRAGAIGRYTRFRIRGGRPPARLDRCLLSISKRPVSCASV